MIFEKLAQELKVIFSQVIMCIQSAESGPFELKS
jgi:hypothetical protein